MMTLADYHDHGDVTSAKSLTLIESDFQTCADLLGVDVRVIKTVAAVESRNGGFFPDDTPVTLFEAHKFHKYTDGLFAASNPDLSSPTWNRALYGKNWREEKKRFYRAEALDQEAALLSCSWGMFQIMGFNFKQCGFKTVFDFVKAMHVDEGAQLKAFSLFINNNPHLKNALQELDWQAFAVYNGTGQIAYYTNLLRTEYARQA